MKTSVFVLIGTLVFAGYFLVSTSGADAVPASMLVKMGKGTITIK